MSKIYRNKTIKDEGFPEAISMDDIEDGTTYGKVKSENIKDGKIEASGVEGLGELAGLDEILDGCVTELKIAADAVTASKINVAALDPLGDLASGVVDNDQLVNGAVSELKILNGAISNAKIAVDAIQGAVIATGAITETKIGNNSISSGKISAGAIVAGKIAAGVITATEIATGAITASKIYASAVTADKIAANSVTAVKILANSITASKIEAGAVTSTKIYADAVTSDKINVSTLAAINANMGTLTAGKISAVNSLRKIELDSSVPHIKVAYNNSNVIQMAVVGSEPKLEIYNGGTIRMRLNKNGLYIFTTTGSEKARIYGDATKGLYINAPNVDISGDLDVDAVYVGHSNVGIGLDGSNCEILGPNHLIPQYSNQSHNGISTRYWHRMYSDAYYAKNTTFQTFDKYDDLQILRDLKFGKDDKLILKNLPKEIHDNGFINFGGMASFNLCASRKIVETIDDLNDRLKALEKQ